MSQDELETLLAEQVATTAQAIVCLRFAEMLFGDAAIVGSGLPAASAGLPAGFVPP